MRDTVTFERLLSALQQSGASVASTAKDPIANPLASAALPIRDAGRDPGLADLWERAAAWAPDPEAAEPPKPPPPSDEVEAIARELDLDSASTRGQILLARRRFMWKYHPDRRPDLSAESASRRVAVANMLVDRALEGLANPATHPG
jgi:hypothetical protein